MHEARRLWLAYEPYHAVVYFAPDARAAYEAVGLRGFWMGYFASRAAPLGPVGPEVVTAAFFNFAPSMVARAVPDAWARATPDAVLAARRDLADRALRALLGDRLAHDDVGEAAEVARRAATAAPLGGRTLAAALRTLAWPELPHLVLWHAATILREHRGDGHVAALVAADVGPCAAHLLAAGAGSTTRKALRAARGWTDKEWDAAHAQLGAHGWLDGDGALTAAGHDARDAVERATDTAALSAWASIDGTERERFRATMQQLAAAIHAAGGVPFPNPMALPPMSG